MTTDFSYNGKQIVSGGPFKPGGKDMPSDARTRVESYKAYTKDLTHPNEWTHERIAECILNEIF